MPFSGVARLVSLGRHLTVLLEYYNPITVLLEYIDLLFWKLDGPTLGYATGAILDYLIGKNRTNIIHPCMFASKTGIN